MSTHNPCNPYHPRQGRTPIFALALCLWFNFSAHANPVTGGFAAADINNAGVIKAARFAITERKQQTGSKLALQQIVQAQTQVVAGLNFQLCMKVRQSKPAKTMWVMAKVYQNLEQQMQLSQWEVVPSCTQAAPDAPKTSQ